MSAPVADIVLLSSRADVAPFLPAVIAAADSARTSFGFLPARAYEDFALQGRLIVAHDRMSDRLAGYVVFGGTPPQARIFQTYVADEYRRSGVGRTLVSEVVRRSEDVSFLSIRVEVASDLEAANDFYKNQGFRSVREKSGGNTRNRVIFTRVRELSSPSLLDLATYGAPGGPTIALTLSTRKSSPFYLIDLNVLFDITRRRGNALGAGRVLAAAMDNSVSLAVSSELIIELQRNTIEDKPDPVLEIAKALPRLKSPSALAQTIHNAALGPLLFADRWTAQKLTVQDKSDIIHLSTAIEERSSGFITSEKAILKCADWFRANHQLDIISPDAFGKRYTARARSSTAYQISVDGKSVSAREVTQDDIVAIKTFLTAHETPDDVINSALAQGTSTSPRQRLLVCANDKIIAFGSWSIPKGDDRVSRLYLFAADEDSAAEPAIEYILDTSARDASAERPAVLQMNPQSEQTLLRAKAIAFGFRPRVGSSARSGKLEKLCLGGVVTPQNWPRLRDQIRELAGIIFPDEPPLFHNATDAISLRTEGGQHASTGLAALEDFVSPAILALPGRPAVIVPIRPGYAESLFRGSRQPSFLDDEQAAILRTRRYFGDTRTYTSIPDQGMIFFYESGYKGAGRSAAIAVARIVRRYLAREETAKKLSEERGVLSASAVGDIAKGDDACVTEFDNVMMFENPIALNALKAMGCADAANMVTARALGSDEALALIEAGRPACAR